MQNSYTLLTQNKLAELKSLINDNSFNAEKPKKNVKIFSKKLASNNDVVKSVYTLNAPFQKVIKCLEDTNFQLKTGEDFFESIEDIPSNEKNVEIHLSKTKGVFLLSGRDFLTASTTEQQDDQYFYVCASIDLPSIVTNKNRVRGEIYINGYSLKKVNQTQTEMVYITSTQYKGNLTQSMSRSMMIDEESTYPADIEKFIQEWK